MASMEEKYDTALIGILQNEGQIAKFLDVFLGFLYRRTDFYRIMKSENDKLGFPPGVAMKLLVNIFKKYEALAAQDEVKRQKLLQERERQTESTAKGDASSKASVPTQTPSPPTEVVKPLEPASPHVASTPQASTVGEEQNAGATATAAVATQPSPGSSGVGGELNEGTGSGAGQEDDGQERLQKMYQANPESYNGAVRENYSWSQSITDTDVRVTVPKSVVKGKDVQVDISKKRLCVRYRGPDGEWQEGVNLEKKEERWWEAVFVDEPKINTRKIDCSRPITDLDDEAQAKIEEMMYNEHRKRLGLPQSHEQKTMDILKQAWDAEGSPFKGRPFDPSAISVDPSGVIKMK
ncbi:hypothetical protein BaRGS_00006754 [Batillaria attramentaria]|uniref:CS domain-containing protein n=1 Tax=Batillaria attramentaria TaxID=370345 RepID=A0ABD0LSI0_9CAEN